MDQSNRLLIAGVVLFGSAVIARRYPSDGIGISPDDLPDEGEIRRRRVSEDVPRSSWKSKRMQDAPRSETVVVTGRRSPITKTMFDKDPELPLDEQRRLANERGARLAKEAAEDEIVVTTRGLRVILPPPTYEKYGDLDAILLKYWKRKSEENPVGKPADYFEYNREEQRIVSINRNRRAESMKFKIASGTRRDSVSDEAINESCLKRIPKMVRIRKLLDRPELLEPSVASDLKSRWVKFQAQCLQNIPEVMNRYLRFNPP
jgi:hypothetical protein